MTVRPAAACLLAVLALGLIPGCSLLAPVASGRLVDIDAHGGLCVQGACRTVTTIERSGRVTVTSGGAAPVSQAIDPGAIAALAAAVDAADYARITAVPFDDLCPTAYDGQELTYTFHPTGRQPVTFSSCEVAVDPADPLFRAVDAVLLALGS